MSRSDSSRNPDQDTRFPGPDDPTPRGTDIVVSLDSGETATARDDHYSDRVRCDHATVRDGAALGRALVAAARERGRGRVVVLAPARLRDGLETVGLSCEAVMPGYYRGEEDCAVLGLALEPCRGDAVDAAACEKVDRILAEKRGAEQSREGSTAATSPRPNRSRPKTERASAADAPAIARLVTASFAHYPTPTGVPAFVAKKIEEGVPFRIVRDGDDVVACASADLQRAALTAELTDCATRPDQRGKGLMQALLSDLMDDMRAMGYPTAYTLARAIEPGMNLAFQRLGFTYQGRMLSSCRIGTGFEDMNVWSRWL